ncbi:lamin tail domain-containing protein [Psychroserpens sp. BH13MA-6]
MKTKHLFNFLIFPMLFIALNACETDDILPALELSVDDENLSEANSEVTITATLNGESGTDIVVPFDISGTATPSADYSLSSNSITISAGNTSGSLTISSIQDEEIEGEETIIISLENASNVLTLSGSQIIIALQDDDSDSDGDGVLDANDDCPNEAGAIENNGCPFLGFLINEVLYDPPSGLSGDANNDGTRDANDDEFIEFFNSGPELDLSGYTVSDDSQIRHTFPAGTIIPVNGVLVLFGGGTPTGDFGGAIVQTASEGLINMSNSGDFVTLADPSGTPILTFDIEPLSNNPNESYTRNPDLTGNFEQHGGIEGANGTLFSPGTKLDGSSF